MIINMKRITVLIALLAAGWSAAHAAPLSTNTAAAERVLLIDPSTMPVAAGSATLTIGALRRADGVYTGDYQVKVFPYFLKNEKGRLEILVSDESLSRVTGGQVVTITGTATPSRKNAKCRIIGATATPAGSQGGRLKLWFTAGNRKMIFEPAYHFGENETNRARAQMMETNLVTTRL